MASTGTVAFGRDTSCIDSLQTGRLVSGVQLVAQRLYHRLITPPYALRGGEEEADFGIDLPGMIGSTDPRELDFMLPVVVRNELLKDPVVDEVTVEANRTEAAGLVSWTLKISVVCGVGPFELLVAVSDVTAELLGVT